jgi:hypothetical protein
MKALTRAFATGIQQVAEKVPVQETGRGTGNLRKLHSIRRHFRGNADPSGWTSRSKRIDTGLTSDNQMTAISC